MATHYKATIAVATDTALPADQMVVTPHVHDTGTLDPNALATTIATNTATYCGVACPVTVKLYIAGAPVPNYPVGSATVNPAGAPLISANPRELALCLSYYTSFNRPRSRGRLYIPFSWVNKHVGSGTPGIRPTTAQMQGARDFANQVMKTMGTGVYWFVWSQVEHQAKGDVTNYYVDDEWDTQRRRGLKPTTRQTGTYP